MIPTSVTNSPPAAGLAQNNGAAAIVVNGTCAAAAAATVAASTAAAAQQSSYSSIVLGLASLILEGRPIADDEYQQQQQQQLQAPQQLQQLQQSQSPPAGSGRLSPRPSTSRAAINITTNPYALASGTPRSSYAQGYGYGQGQRQAHGDAYSHVQSSGSSSSSSSATHQRWTQKLCQLRQLSPAAQSMSIEPELVSLAINELNAERGDFEIVRRVMLNRAGAGAGGGAGLGLSGLGLGLGVGVGVNGEQLTTSNSSAGSSPGSGTGSGSGLGSGADNILHSLQSLASTCLRGTPAVPSVESRPLSLALSVGVLSSTASAASLLDYNYSTGAGAGGLAGVYGGVGGGGGVATAAAATATTTTTTTTATASNEAAAAGGTASGNGACGGSSCASRPKHGPHCDQFLRKMGLAKGEAADAEEHFCDMSYINITCSRWRAHCLKMEAILARREPVCIEVYLGPAGHKILLEQWIISGKEKVPPPTMTLPSLCSAIRSQLYFSQIVAWCDLLRKCDPSVYDSGRVIFASSGAGGSNAGDLAGHSATAAAAGGGGAGGLPPRRPRLNIFYRIRPHDGSQNDGGFSAKANVHNFPHVNIAENFSVSVCVKSLPRFNGGLPHIAPPAAAAVAVAKPRLPAASTPTGGGGMCAATPTGLGARIAISTTPSPTTATCGSSSSGRGSTGDRRLQQAAELQLEEEELDGSREELDGHRERQLQKYRKRMQRRDKKRERKPSEQLLEPMDEGGSEELPAQAPVQAQAQQVAMNMMTLAAPQPRRIAMISTGTQTALSSCQQCGSEKTLLCLNCSAGEEQEEQVERKQQKQQQQHEADEEDATSASDMEDTSSCSLSSCDLIVGTPRNKAELLLQAIQRTPKNRKPPPCNDFKAPRSAQLLQQQPNPLQQQQQQAPARSGCQLCKRQKTQHNFSNGRSSSSNNNNNNNNSLDNSMEQEQDEEQQQQQEQHTKLTPNIKSCTLQQTRCQTPPEEQQQREQREQFVVQFKTPISHVPLKLQELQQQQQQQQQQQPLARPPNQLRLNCSGLLLLSGDKETPPTAPPAALLLRKPLPKVNLTTIFCSSAPIAGDSEQLAFSFDTPTLSQAQSQSQSLLTPTAGAGAGVGAGTLPVQKSYSAPTLPNALSVSPRFAKQAAFYKRRSRHLSDRSDRSSLGSDEQLSDEDFEPGVYSPAAACSPLKTRARLCAQFGGRALLGNLEESLLQKRLLPKIEVAGFRLQLGASGGFCPTQLTIPASSYFYELHGETLSTPYLVGGNHSEKYLLYADMLFPLLQCEIRLPRKGYFVPRSGTVQATLLNPMGTVVRMFVIPYDMRDMPPLHRTFIRQRILAEELPGNAGCGRESRQQQQQREPSSPTAAMSTTGKLGHFISAEQMKRLRYSIHLRFQTSRSGRLSLHTDIRLLISRRTDCDTAAAHAKGLLEAPNELVTDTLMPTEPRYSARQESPGKI
ncbi:hypothetical protein KR222_006803 [Zaprionus bogoriensis]|nr:hypothetical protein KR222_006803 [Zaprionus bogoriensis]